MSIFNVLCNTTLAFSQINRELAFVQIGQLELNLVDILPGYAVIY